MRENPYKRLPPIECKQDGSLYRMTPAQRKQANALIRRECCCYEDGNCMLLDDGDTCACPQTASFSVCCKWFRWSVLPQIGTLEAEIFRDKELKRCTVCGRVFVPKSNRAKYCPASSSQAAYRSFYRKRQNSLAPLLLLSPQSHAALRGSRQWRRVPALARSPDFGTFCPEVARCGASPAGVFLFGRSFGFQGAAHR